MAMNRCLNCAREGTAAASREQVVREQKRLKYVPWRSGAERGRGNDRGGAAPAGLPRKLMPAPSVEPLLPASDAPRDNLRCSRNYGLVCGQLDGGRR